MTSENRTSEAFFLQAFLYRANIHEVRGVLTRSDRECLDYHLLFVLIIYPIYNADNDSEYNFTLPSGIIYIKLLVCCPLFYVALFFSGPCKEHLHFG